MTVKDYILLFFCLASFFFNSCRNNEEDAKPNIIIIFTDDQGYGDLSCYGATDFSTPEIDKLASRGIKFTDFYAGAPVCTPSRAALMTGKTSKQVGLHVGVLFPYSQRGLSPEETTLPELLQSNGYRTACIGKWHLGHLEHFMPNNHGFDYFYGVPYSNDMDKHYYPKQDFQSPPIPVYINKEKVDEGPDQAKLTKMWTDASVEFIKENNKNPFFLYLAHNMPHKPLFARKQFLGSSENGIYGDVIHELDWSMGEIVKTLEEEHLLENTIIIFTSDNGPAPQKNIVGGSAGPLRGIKGSTWEGGMRVPGIISWPAKIPQGVVCTQPASVLDLLPTLTNISGGTLPEDLKLAGFDISQILYNPGKKADYTFILPYYGPGGKLEALRYGDWKLHVAKSRNWDVETNGEFPVSLYNLREDIGEMNNLANDHPEKVKIMMQLIDDLNQ